MWGSGTRAAGLLALALAALVSACAAPSPAGTDTAFGTTFATAPASFRSPTRAPDIKDLTGLRPADIVSILGPPDLQRDEPPAELWQYRAADCVLNLFFYDNAGGFRLSRVETWQRSLSAGSAPVRCHDGEALLKARFTTQSAL